MSHEDPTPRPLGPQLGSTELKTKLNGPLGLDTSNQIIYNQTTSISVPRDQNHQENHISSKINTSREPQLSVSFRHPQESQNPDTKLILNHVIYINVFPHVLGRIQVKKRWNSWARVTVSPIPLPIRLPTRYRTKNNRKERRWVINETKNTGLGRVLVGIL